jgi:glycosyltransferase involved in cell wall biosynthesis
MRILFLSRWYPYPADNGSKIRIWNLLRGLSEQHDVTLLCFIDSETVDLKISELHDVCEAIQVVPWKAFDPHSLKARLGFLRMRPRSYVDTYSPQMQSYIERNLESNSFDLVIASEWTMASYSSSFDGKAALFEDVELGVFHGRYATARSTYERVRQGLTWFKHHRYLSRILRDFNSCTVPSSTELKLFQSVVSDYKNVTVIPNCINLADYDSVPENFEPNSLIFTGSFRYAVNYEAMVWFLRDIYPSVRSQVPGVHLSITGDHAGLKLPSTAGVTLTGFVPDIRPFIASSWASVVPLLSGGGTRLKILEAMALRTPVITTSKGAEGLEVIHDKTVLIADEAQEFARAVVRLLKEPELRVYLTENAYQLVSEHYNWATAMPKFLQLVEGTALARRNRQSID